MGLGSLITALVFLGCSSESASHDEADATSLAAPEAGAADTGFWRGSDEDGAAEDAVVATHWDLGGSLLIQEGEIVPDSSMLVARLLGSEQEVVCQGFVSLSSSDSQPAPEDGILGWWTIRIEEIPSESCLVDEFPGGKEFLLGIGVMHPEIRAVIGADDDFSEVAVQRLNAMYVSLDDEETIWVFGAAGVPDSLSGENDAASSEDQMDGHWQFEPVYSFPI